MELTQGKVAIIDDEDWVLISPYSWHARQKQDGAWYATTGLDIPVAEGGPKVLTLQMHRVIVGAPSELMVDHRDHDGLNNRRSNLRVATNGQNQQNTGARGGSSLFKGVSWDKRKQKWRAAFNWDGKTHFVGNFADEKQAALAYDAAIVRLAGEFARPNFTELETRFCTSFQISTPARAPV